MDAAKTRTAALAALLVSGWSTLAAAGGVAIDAERIAPAHAAELARAIAGARQADPAAFAAVAAVDSYKPSGVAKSRHHRPEAARAFMRLGRRALLPMLDLVAWQAPAGELDPAAWRALGVGLLQAIGVLRDERAAPVLEAVFLSAAEPAFVDKAAEGLGMLCGAHQQALLVSHGAAGDRLRAAATVGLGHCRTLASARHLAGVLGQRSEPALAARAARALGYVASSWALAADRSVDAATADAVRRIAADALLGAFADAEPELRGIIGRAALMLEHEAALAAIDRTLARSAASVRDELTTLRSRLARNLTR